MDPVYFAQRLTLYEAEAYLRGVQRRLHSGWEQARQICFYAAKPHCSSDFTFESMGRFPWEEVQECGECDADRERELRALQRRAEIDDMLIQENYGER